MKVLVTGGAGFIASHIVDALLDAGHSVAVVDDLSAGSKEHVNLAASFYQVDITDGDALKAVFASEKPDLVNHHAAQTSVRHSMSDPTHDASVNVLGSINVLQQCVDHGVGRIVFSSTCAVYSEPETIPMSEKHPVRPQSAYGMAKHAVEDYMRYYSDVYGIRYKVFRYGNVFGPRQSPSGEAGVVAIFTGQLLTGVTPTIFGDGTKTRDYVYVGDVVSANLVAMGDVGDNDVYNLAGGAEVTDFEIFDAVRTATGVHVEPMYADKRPGEADRVSLDCAKARRVFKWSQSVGLDEGVGYVVEHYRRTHPA